MTKRDEVLIALLKHTLEYNAIILNLTTLYAGQMNSMKPQAQKNVSDKYKKIHKQYAKEQEALIRQLEE